MTASLRRGRNATQPLKKAFLRHLRRLHYLQPAADATGVDRVTVWRWREHDPEFALAYASVLEQTTEDLEAAAVRRATRRYEPSDTLLIFLLKARRPDVYRDRVDLRAQVEATVDATVVHLEAVRAHVQEADVERLTRALLGSFEGGAPEGAEEGA